MRDRMLPFLVRNTFYIFILSLAIGQLGRIPLIANLEGGVYITDFIVVILYGVWLLWRISLKSFEVNLVDILLVLFVSVLAIALLNSFERVTTSQFVIASFYLLRLVLYLSLFRISSDASQFWSTSIHKVLTILTGVFVSLSTAQFFLFPDFSKYVEHGWDPHYYRVLSTFFDPNFTGAFLVLLFLYHLYDIYRDKGKNNSLLFSVILVGILSIVALLTFSRSTYLSLAVGITIFSLFKDRRLVAGMLFLAILAFLFIPRVQTRIIGAIQIDETANMRIEEYKKSFEIIEDNVLLGVGFNTLRYVKEDIGQFRDQRGVSQPSGHSGAGTDNSILFTMATSGVIGFVALLLFLFGLAYSGIRAGNESVVIAMLGSLLTHSMFVNSFYYSWILGLFVIMMGIFTSKRLKSSDA